MKNYLDVANSTALWFAAVPITVVVIIQAIIFYKRAMASASIVDLSKEDAKKAFKVGAFSAIGPAMGVFVVMLGLMAVIGGPLAWMRLSIIGAAPTELAAAEMAAKGERVIIVTGCINVLVSRVSGTLTKYNSCIA